MYLGDRAWPKRYHELIFGNGEIALGSSNDVSSKLDARCIIPGTRDKFPKQQGRRYRLGRFCRDAEVKAASRSV